MQTVSKRVETKAPIRTEALPPIPEKRYFTIGETSTLCAVKSHVLRYWEQEFSQLKPCKRRGNRRYYQHDDVLLIRKIRHLLYDEGYTIGGARSILSGKQQNQEKKSIQHLIHDAIDELEAVLEVLS